MLRRVLRKKKFTFEDCRNMHRNDREQFDWMVENGLFVEVGDAVYEVTEKGWAAADLGLYEV